MWGATGLVLVLVAGGRLCLAFAQRQLNVQWAKVRGLHPTIHDISEAQWLVYEQQRDYAHRSQNVLDLFCTLSWIDVALWAALLLVRHTA